MNATTTSEDTVFEAKIRKNTDFIRLIRILNQLVDESPVKIDDEGIRFRTADPSLVGMMDLHLKPKGFSNYRPPGEELRFKIDVGQLKDKVTEAKKADDLSLSVTREQAGGNRQPVLHIVVKSDGVESKFSISTSEINEYDQPDTENLEFTGSAIVATDKLAQTINRMNDSVEITLTENHLQLQSQGDQGHTTVAFPEKSKKIHRIQLENGDTQSLYSTDYLTNITQLKQVASRTELSFGDDYPLRIKASNNWFHFRYTIAPRVEED